jgi:GNAT superfamily N-acetyltransferase
MSGVGKSTLLAELRRRGRRTVETDEGDWCGPDGRWDEPRMTELLAAGRDLVVCGTVENQGEFYDRFEHVVLLSAPLEVLLSRVTSRTTNPYGKTPAQRAEIERYLRSVEPLLRRGATLELDGRRPVGELADAVERLLVLDVRPARLEDTRAVGEIWAAGWRDGHLGHVPEALVALRTPESFLERAAGRVADTTVATVAGQVAGFVMVDADEVEQVFVAAGHRGSGVAGRLLLEAERQVAAAGHATAWLAVVPGNARARRFYEKRGWVDDGGFDLQISHDGTVIPVPCRRYVKRLYAPEHQ